MISMNFATIIDCQAILDRVQESNSPMSFYEAVRDIDHDLPAGQYVLSVRFDMETGVHSKRSSINVVEVRNGKLSEYFTGIIHLNAEGEWELLGILDATRAHAS